MNFVWICAICIIVGYLLRTTCKFLLTKKKWFEENVLGLPPKKRKYGKYKKKRK